MQTVAAFKADIQAAKLQGRKIGISIGGADNPVTINTNTSQTFIDSMKVCQSFLCNIICTSDHYETVECVQKVTLINFESVFYVGIVFLVLVG